MNLLQDFNLNDDGKQKINKAVGAAMEVFQEEAGEYSPNKKMFRRKGTRNELLPVCQFGRTITVQNKETGETDSIQVVIAVGVGAGSEFLLTAIECAVLADNLMAQAVEEAQETSLLRQAEKNKA